MKRSKPFQFENVACILYLLYVDVEVEEELVVIDLFKTTLSL